MILLNLPVADASVYKVGGVVKGDIKWDFVLCGKVKHSKSHSLSMR